MAHLRLKSMLGKPQIKPNDRITGISPKNKVKFNVVIIIGYETPLYFYETVTKALIRLPFALRKEVYKFTKDSTIIDGSLNLIMFQRWLENN